ncbi:MAG: ABC transporter ATP-binding protein [Limnobacter sp.]|nr:ABC transporter ATP-binding protein [Limnobacter sp.]
MIEVNNLSKSFKLYDRPSDRLKEMIFRRSFHRSHLALKQLSFQVREGETLGVLGKNGAGKSTLLKILTGVMLPDSGEVKTSGRLTGLLELGTGFDRNLTGLQNIVGNALLLGMTMEEIEARKQEIIEFSELGRYIAEPIRTYSSGMVMRLAFAIAIHADPTCFVVDEALSVGDGHFQQKCMKRIREFREAGGSIVFVSHDLNAVKMICDRALVLDGGRIVCDGDPEAAVNHYNKIMADMDADEYRLSHEAMLNRSYGSGEITIQSATLLGRASESSTVSSGEICTLRVQLHCKKQVPPPTVGFMIRDRFGQDIFGTNTLHLKAAMNIDEGETKSVGFLLPMNLAPGKYTITFAVHSDEHHMHDCYHWCDNLIGFEVAGSHVPLFSGVVFLDTQIVG